MSHFHTPIRRIAASKGPMRYTLYALGLILIGLCIDAPPAPFLYAAL